MLFVRLWLSESTHFLLFFAPKALTSFLNYGIIFIS